METTPDMQYGKTYPAPFRREPPKEPILRLCLKRSQTPKFQYLNLNGGQPPEWCEGDGLTSLGACTTVNTSERHSDAGESLLSWILEDNPPPKYSLSKRACEGILRRAERRGKALPPILEAALVQQAAQT